MPTIQLQNISKKYGKKEVLTDVNATIKSGECFAIIGSNGKGKSTLLKILAGIIPANKGKVSYDSLPLSSNRKKILNDVGYFPETPSLYEELTVKENLALFRKLSGAKDKMTPEKLSHWLNILQVDGYLDAKAGTLSKGMQYKISFIRSLINNPKTLLLDEPNANIDNDTLLQLKKELIQLKETGMTIIIVTHQLAFLTGLADRIAFLQNELKSELSANEFFKMNKRPLLEVDCEPASDDCIKALSIKDPDLQINQERTHIRLQLKESQKNYNDFISEILTTGLKVKQFYEVAITPEQLYKRIIKKD
jgi:ABC-2 type transport system ATP-binding protein